MEANFAPSLAAILKHEGGYVCNPKDPGGATCNGVTQVVYNDWRAANGLPSSPVRGITKQEVEEIFLDRYWDPISADSLPPGVDYATLDFAYNSGVNRASRFLQRCAGVTEDGQIGPDTIAAVNKSPPVKLIDDLCDMRLVFLKSLKTWRFFGRGWNNRVADVRETAKAMAS